MLNLNTVTICGLPQVTEHPMWNKMWQRAGLDPKLAKSRFRPIYQGLEDLQSPIITLGEQALQYVGQQSDLFRWRGRQINTGRFIVYPTLEPHRMLPRFADEEDDDEGKGLNHAPARFQGTWVWDVQQALRLGLRPRRQPSFEHYCVDPPAHVWQQWVHDLMIGPRLSFDIETAYKMSQMDDEEWEASGLTHGQILRISFCSHPGYSISVSWTSTYMDGIKYLLAADMAKIVWNGALFDVPRLEAEGLHVGGRIYDYQDGWHIVQSDLPKGLEWVTSFYTTFQPWKHLSGSDPGLYSCIDSDAALQNAMGIDEALAKNYQTHLFERHVTDLMPLLKRAGQRGNLIDLGYSYSLEKEMLVHRDQMEQDVQPMVPEELKPRKRYKRQPDCIQATGLDSVTQEYPTTYITIDGRKFEAVKVESDIKVCSHCRATVNQWADHMKGRKKGTKKNPDDFNPCKAADAKAIKVPGTVIEWDEILPWNPNSSDQLKDYVTFHNHPMGLNRQTDQPSVGGKHLEKLAKKYGKTHPVYPLVAEYKKVSKTISTYVYHNYADPFGIIHSTYTNAPSTFRLAAQNLNLTNVGKRETNKWTKRARRQIVARPGHIFVDADSTSIEAVVTGYLIGDDAFMKMAGKSIHAWLCCQELGWDFNDQTLEEVKSKHKDLYNKMKTAIYLLLYGGDPYLMHMENPENFPTVADARAIQEKIFNLIPKLQEWQERTREQAKKEGVLTSPWGYKHHFYDVYTFKRNKQGQIEYDHQGRPKIKLGKDGKRCLAFPPQNSAASFGRDSLLILGQSKWGPYMSANCFVHDGYTLEVPVEMQDEAEQFLVETLTRPVPELGGIRIGCESGKGYNWADVDPDRKFWSDGNPGGMKTVRKVEVF